MGKYIIFSYDRYVIYKGSCQYDSSGTDFSQFYGKLLDYDKMVSKKEGQFCKYFFYFQAANCGKNCKQDDLSVMFYTYIKQPVISQDLWFNIF